MRTPSIKTLARIFGDNAKRAKVYLLFPNTRGIDTPAVRALRSECFNPPTKYMVRLTALNELGGFHGVECIETVKGEFAEYLNAGDCYAETVIYWRGAYRVQTIGDFVETMERQRVHFK